MKSIIETTVEPARIATPSKDPVCEAIRAIEQIEFNARDYYVAGPDAWKAAQAEHVARLGQLSVIAGDLQIIELHVLDMIDAKERQTAK